MSPDSVLKLIESTPVVDMTAPASPGIFLTPDEAYFNRFVSVYEAAGVNWVSFTLGTDMDKTIESGVVMAARARHFFLHFPKRFVLVEKAADVLRARQENKMAISFNFQGTNPVGGNLQMVETYKKLGVHHMLMAYNQKNAVGDGCHERTDGGLSRYGISLIQEMNRVGMVVDVSHTGYKTSMEAFETSCQPVIFSHANCRSLYDHERNITDEQIVACAKTGGVIGLTGVGLFMSKEGSDVSAGIIASHIDHAVNLVGPDHVGLGLDYIMNTQAMLQEIAKNKDVFTDAKGSYDVPQLHFATPAVIPGVAETLLKKGYAEKDVRGILGENWIRVFESVIG